MNEFNNLYDEFPNPVVTGDYTNNAPTNTEVNFKREQNQIGTNDLSRPLKKSSKNKMQSLAASLIALIVIPITGIASLGTSTAAPPTSSIESVIQSPSTSQQDKPLLTEFYGVDVQPVVKELKLNFSLDFIDEKNEYSDFKAFLSITPENALNLYEIRVKEGGIFPLDLEYASQNNTSVDYSLPPTLDYIELNITDPTATQTIDLLGSMLSLESPLNLTVVCTQTTESGAKTVELSCEEYTIDYEPFAQIYLYDDEPIVLADKSLNLYFDIYDCVFSNGSQITYLSDYVVTVTDENGLSVVYESQFAPYPSQIDLSQLQLTEGQTTTLNIKITATSIFASDTPYQVMLLDQDVTGLVAQNQ